MTSRRLGIAVWTLVTCSMLPLVVPDEHENGADSAAILRQWQSRVTIRMVPLSDFGTEPPSSFDILFWRSKRGEDTFTAVRRLATTVAPLRKYRDQSSRSDFVILLLSGTLNMGDIVELKSVDRSDGTLVLDFKVRVLAPEDSPGFEYGEAVAFVVLPIQQLPDSIRSMEAHIKCNRARTLPNGGLPQRVTVAVREEGWSKGSP